MLKGNFDIEYSDYLKEKAKELKKICTELSHPKEWNEKACIEGFVLSAIRELKLKRRDAGVIRRFLKDSLTIDNIGNVAIIFTK